MKFRGKKILHYIGATTYLLLAIGCSTMIYLCLSKGNWIGGFFMFPALGYLCVDRFYHMVVD